MYEICQARTTDTQGRERRCVAMAWRHQDDPTVQHYDHLGSWRADGVHVDPHKLG